MFRSPTYHSTADGDASTIGEELTTPYDAQEATPTKTTSTPTASHHPPSQVLKRPYDLRSTRRNFHHTITNLPQQLQTSREIKATREKLHTAQQRPYEPSRAAHTIPSNSLQSSKMVQPPKTDTTLFARPFLISSLTPSLSTTDMETILLPVQVELAKLKATTMPPANSRVHAKSAMQVLKERLLPIGKHVVQQSESLGVARSRAEYEICQYITDYYWPQRLVRADAMRVMEIYRNTMFLESIEWDCGVEADERGPEVDDGGFLFEDVEDEGDIPGLIDRAPWQPHGDGLWRPVNVEHDWEGEIGRTGELDEVGYEVRDYESRRDHICWGGHLARGG